MHHDEDVAAREIEVFLRHLQVRGRSGYALRSYRQGLSNFPGWLAEEDVALSDVRRAHVEAYVAKFAVGRARRRSTIG
jgi:site-specific recombinase XerD